MGTRVLSLWLPYLAIDRLRQENLHLTPVRSSLPMATFEPGLEDRSLAALCPRAERAGLMPGMAFDDARQQVPGLVLHPAAPEDDRRFLESNADWCERYTPFVAIDRSFPSGQGGALWLDIGSSAHLTGGEASLLARLLAHFRRKGIEARAAIADHPGSAWAACRFGNEEQRILPANGARVALAPWPVDALRLESRDCARLASAGLDRIEHLYALPRRAIGARFGDHVAKRLDQALGLVDEPIALDIPKPAQQAQMIFADPVTEREDLPLLVERLLHQLCTGLGAAGLGARRLTLAVYRVDNSTATCSVGIDRSTNDRQQWSALLGDRCEKIDPGFGLERAILDAVDIEPLIPESIHWRGLGTAAVPACREHETWRQHVDDGWICGEDTLSLRPRRRPDQAAEPYAGGRQATALALAPACVETSPVRESLPRPLRLLRQPEPIEAIAPLPDEPPVLFRWRQGLHKVIGAKGPETVAPDWVCPASKENVARSQRSGPEMRDYFAVEDSEGARFWLFREGRYDRAPGTMPRWFLHGLFG